MESNAQVSSHRQYIGKTSAVVVEEVFMAISLYHDAHWILMVFNLLYNCGVMNGLSKRNQSIGCLSA